MRRVGSRRRTQTCPSGAPYFFVSSSRCLILMMRASFSALVLPALASPRIAAPRNNGNVLRVRRIVVARSGDNLPIICFVPGMVPGFARGRIFGLRGLHSSLLDSATHEPDEGLAPAHPGVWGGTHQAALTGLAHSARARSQNGECHVAPIASMGGDQRRLDGCQRRAKVVTPKSPLARPVFTERALVPLPFFRTWWKNLGITHWSTESSLELNPSATSFLVQELSQSYIVSPVNVVSPIISAAANAASFPLDVCRHRRRAVNALKRQQYDELARQLGLAPTFADEPMEGLLSPNVGGMRSQVRLSTLSRKSCAKTMHAFDHLGMHRMCDQLPRISM